MDEQLRWTQSLGDAFLGQEAAVMDTVQQLRQRAQAAGNLQSTEQLRVQQQGPAIVIQSPPEIVYVPYYDPLVVYGTWWWPAYRPVAWAPWPGYVRAPGASVGFWFGRPSGVSLSFFFGDFDWGHRAVRVVRPTAYYYRPPSVVINRTTVVNRNVTVERNAWQHDPHHRRGVEYRAPEVRQQFASAQARAPQPRQERRAESRPQPQPQPQPQVRQEHRAEPQLPSQVRQEPRAEPHAQPQVRKEPPRAEPHPERREARKDSRDDRGERGEHGKGGGERS
jgi:hypothetical protein